MQEYLNNLYKELPEKMVEYIKNDEDLQEHLFKDKFDAYEADLLIRHERWEFKPYTGKKLEKRKKILVQAAINTEKKRKEKQVTFRITQWDLDKIQARAQQEGMPYQTLICSIIHKYVTGQLVSK